MSEIDFDTLMAQGETVLEEELDFDTLMAQGEDVDIEQMEAPTPVMSNPEQPPEGKTSLLEDVADFAGSAVNTGVDVIEGALTRTRTFSRGYVPFANHVSAFVDATIDPVTDIISDKIYGESPSTVEESFGQRYARSLEKMREVEKQDIESLGKTKALVYEGAGMALSFNKFAKLFGITDKSGKASKIAFDTSLVLTREIDRSGINRESLNTAGWATMFSTAVHTIGGPVGRLASSVGRGGRRLVGMIDDKVFSSAIQSTMKATNESIQEFTSKHGKDALERVTKKIGLGTAEVAENYPLLIKNIDDSLDNTGEALKEAWDEADMILGKGSLNVAGLVDNVKKKAAKALGKNPPKEVVDALMNEIDSTFINSSNKQYVIQSAKELNDFLIDLNSGGETFLDSISNLSPKIQEKVKKTVFGTLRNQLKRERKSLIGGLKYKQSIGEGVSPKAGFTKGVDIDLEEASKLAKQYADEAKGWQKEIDQLITSPNADPKNLKAQVGQLEGLVADSLQNAKKYQSMVDDAGKIGVTVNRAKDAASKLDDGITKIELEKISSNLEQLSKDYYETADFKDVVVGTANKATKTTGGGFVPWFKGLLSSPFVQIGYLLGGTTGAISAFAAEKPVRMLTRELAKAYGTTTDETLRAVLKKTMDGMDTFARLNKDPFVRSLATKAAHILDDKDIAPDEAWSKLDSIFSQTALYNKPIERNSAAAMENIEHILAIAADIDPVKGKILSNAISNKTNLAPVFDQISKLPGMEKYIQTGEGWDGMVFDPQEKLAMQNRISLDYPLMTTAQKLKEKDKIESGLIPDWSNLPGRQPSKLTPGDKGKGSY